MPVKTITADPATTRLSDSRALYPSVDAKWPSLFWHPAQGMSGQPTPVKTITATPEV